MQMGQETLNKGNGKSNRRKWQNGGSLRLMTIKNTLTMYFCPYSPGAGKEISTCIFLNIAPCIFPNIFILFEDWEKKKTF